MADKKTPNPKYIAFTVTGYPQEFRLVKDYNNICDAENVSGCNLFRAMFGLSGMSAQEVRALTFACLLDWNPKITLEEVGDLIQASDESNELGNVLGALGKALGAEEDDKPKDPPLPPPAPTPESAPAEG